MSVPPDVSPQTEVSQKTSPDDDLPPSGVEDAVAAVIRQGQAGGSAFLIAPDVAVTATHVAVDGIGAVVNLRIGRSQALVPARVSGWWPMSQPGLGTDVALLKLESPTSGIRPLELDADGASADTPVFVVEASGTQRGHVTAVGVTVDVAPDGRLVGGIEIDVRSTPGSSGAPVVRQDTGRVIGMVVAGNETITYCVPAAQILAALSGEVTPAPPEEEGTADAGPVAAAQAWVPGYVADTAEGRDQLGITPHVNALAALLASRSLTPPASIGLFGDWGSGKSFFMRQMRERIYLLSTSARRAEDSAPAGVDPRTVSTYCSAVRQVSFNAWHYADTNLWASLAAHIFDSLAAPRDIDVDARRDPEERERITLQDTLQEHEVERDMLAARVAALAAEESRLSAVRVSTIRDVFVDQARAKDFALLADVLETVDPSVAQLRSELENVTSAGRELRDTWAELRGRSRSWIPAVAVIGVALLVVAAAVAVSRGWAQPLLALVPGITAVLVSVGAALRPILRVAAAARRVLRRVDEHQAKRLDPLTEERQRLEKQLATANEEVAALTARADELEIGRRLERFLAERGASTDYHRHLGVIALARRDFEILARLLSTSGRTSATGPLDRIVLYIDDLDRCPPDTVVKVLEAVHLLLALPLFVVVVAVDPRWLLRAVQRHYRTMLAPIGADSQGGQRPATAMDYLEKIFQIPFSLPAMQPTGFTQLMAASMRPGGGTAGSQTTAGTAAAADGEASPPGGGAPADTATTGAGNQAPDGAGELPQGERAGADQAVEAIELHPRALLVEDSEVNLLGRLDVLIPTPRAAKRLANVYQLTRVQVPAAELDRFVGTEARPGRCAPTMLLLAVLVGFPGEAEEFLHRLARASARTRVVTLVAEDGEDSRLGRALRALLRPGAPWPAQAAAYQAEISRVSRFSFRTAVLLDA